MEQKKNINGNKNEFKHSNNNHHHHNHQQHNNEYDYYKYTSYELDNAVQQKIEKPKHHKHVSHNTIVAK